MFYAWDTLMFVLSRNATVVNSLAIYRHGKITDNLEVLKGRQTHMPQSLVNQMMHIVFSTKARAKLITPELAARLYPYFGGIARQHGCRLMAVGGMPDHVHLLLSLPATLALSKAVQLIKGNSSKWIERPLTSTKDLNGNEDTAPFRSEYPI